MAVNKRKDRAGTWQYVFDLERGPDGKRRQVKHGGFVNKRAAEDAEAAERTRLGVDPIDSKTTVEAYLERWLKVYAEPNVKVTTFVRYRQQLRLHVIPVIGRKLLGKLQPLEIEACYETIRAHRSERTTLNIHRVLHEALEKAVKWRLVTYNPAAAVTAPRPPKTKREMPEVEVARVALQAAEGHRYAPIFWMAALTGLREGEIVALRWPFVQLDGPDAHVSVVGNAIRVKGKGMILSEPKTEGSAARVDLGPDAVALLREQRVRQLEEKMAERLDYQDQGLVFADPLGRLLDGSYVGRVWKQHAAQHGLEGFTFHDLRHLHATMGLKAGVSLKVIQERLRHSSITTTGDTYSHVAPTMQRDASELIERVLGKSKA